MLSTEPEKSHRGASIVCAWGEGTMIVLIGATVMYLTALQASITAPTEAFRACLREAATKASGEKVAGTAYEAYARNACSVQMGSLKSAVIAFRMKNGMAKKAAADDAEMTVDDYVATSVDKYQFMADMNKPQAPATPASTPPTANSQPPK
jgi:hypothetical protein